jgi:putative FmdB family regulatory protein
VPLYDYRCEDCGHEFEAQRPVARRDEADCPRCRGRRVRRLVRAVPTVAAGRGAGCAPARSGFG